MHLLGQWRITRRTVALLAIVAASTAVTLISASSAGAYGEGATHDMWQIGFSINCVGQADPTRCPGGIGALGGSWGWIEFDRSADGTQTWGDAQTTFCFHTVGGGGAGAGHTSIDITSWTISGLGTFVASGTETDSFRGMTETFTFTDDPLTAQTTLVRAVHILELRAALDSVRVAHGLPAFGWTDPTLTPGSTPVKVVHLTELRAALSQAYQAPGPTYTDPTVEARVTVIKAIHLKELRDAVRALE